MSASQVRPMQQQLERKFQLRRRRRLPRVR
jgi:hypothetical protein